MKFDALPIEQLIERRRIDLELRKGQLMSKCGFSNSQKSPEYLHRLYSGNDACPLVQKLLEHLPEVIGISREALDTAIAESQQILREKSRAEKETREAEKDAREAAWRAAFVPHAIFLTEHTTPTQITMCALTGGPGRWLTIALDRSLPPSTFAEQALAIAKNTKIVPFFGAPLGVMVNYSPDSSIHYDLEGNVLSMHDQAYRLGVAFVSFR